MKTTKRRQAQLLWLLNQYQVADTVLKEFTRRKKRYPQMYLAAKELARATRDAFIESFKPTK